MDKSGTYYADWCIEQHRKTNHFYDTYLPYEFHLRMVFKVYTDFAYLLPDDLGTHANIMSACYGHDLIEDTRTSYNDCKKVLGVAAADIVYALTNEKGKNRKERASEKYYAGIRSVEYADFVKLCDRIANVQYSKMTDSMMFGLYAKENDTFLLEIGNNYPEMNEYLVNLFKTDKI